MPICMPVICGPRSNIKAWKKERTTESVRCQGKCHAVYPGRLMVKVKDGVCDECREKATRVSEL